MMNENTDLREEMTPDETAETVDGTEQAAEKETAEESTSDTAGETVSECSGKEKRAEKKQVKKLEAALAETEKELARTKSELAESNERYMRMLAEYDNYRKRTQKEKDTIYGDAYSDAVKQILPIVDNLELAAKQSADADAAAILGGVEMILKSAQENLGKLNIVAFGAVGDAFDPNRHTAVFHIEDESLGENIVAEVLQKGYERDGRIIRYAVVKVAN